MAHRLEIRYNEVKRTWRGILMAFLKKAAVLGSNDYYEVNPQAKKYLFRDYGFKETASGNLQLIRPLDTNLQNKQSPKLKIK